MSPAARLLARLQRQARWRVLAIDAAIGVPIGLALAALLARLAGPGWAVALLGVWLLALLLRLAWQWRRHDRIWRQRQLDARYPSLQDSADLLDADPARLTALQRMQQQRMQAELARLSPDLRARWAWAWVASAAVPALLVLAWAAYWPDDKPDTAATPTGISGTVAAQAGPLRLLASGLQLQPPAYTGLPAQSRTVLDARAPQGSRLQWRLRFSRMPDRPALQFLDGPRLALEREGEDWVATSTLQRSTLYRVVSGDGEPLAGEPLHRLDAEPDQPPRVKVIQPEQSLSLVSLGQRSWQVVFEAEDDHGLANSATLRLTLAQGSGENISFHERQITLAGSGSRTRKRYQHTVDFATLGYAAGDDLIVQLQVEDNRPSTPQRARSPSVILRWPADLGQQATGLEGLVKTTLPAYFRSQRQIIIDAEALQKQKRALPAERFVQRSDAIGVDQRILRLRYGQFLGEEAEGAPQLPTNDAPVAADDEHDHADTQTQAQEPDPDHGAHAHDTPARAAPVFGSETDVLAEYGHTHDHAEAATLLDPETRTILKQALDQMWQSELHLRQGHPDQALPYAYKALGFIKQVQQASRIYLAKTAPEPPSIDLGRRLGGDRKGFARRGDSLVAAPPIDTTLPALWRDLDADRGLSEADLFARLDALQDWLDDHRDAVADPLALVAAIDALRQQPDCADCRVQLQARLWPVLPSPPAQVRRRTLPDAQGRRYLQGLSTEEGR